MRARELLKWVVKLETADVVEAVREKLKSETKTQPEN
jgi:hypothetical protein